MSFEDMLEQMLGDPAPEPEPPSKPKSAIDQTLEEQPAELDDFAKKLNQILAGDEAPSAPEIVYEEHDWRSTRETIYECDDYVFRCTKCFREIRIGRDETLGEALESHNVNPVCSEQIVADVDAC